MPIVRSSAVRVACVLFALCLVAGPAGADTPLRFWADRTSPAFEDMVRAHLRLTRIHRPAETRAVRYLAISGGGRDGAFAAGFLAGWTASGRRPAFEVVTGVSAGALIAPFAFLGPAYDRQLEQFFTQLSDRDVYSERGPLAIWADALYDSALLRRLVETAADDRFIEAVAAEGRRGRRLIIQTTELHAERPVAWDLTALAASSRPDKRAIFVDVLLASAAIPALFPPVSLPGETGEPALHVDGGVSAQIFFAPSDLPLPRLERATFGQPRRRTLYVLRNGKLDPETRAVDPKLSTLAERSLSVLIRLQSMSDLRRMQRSAEVTGTPVRVAAIPAAFDVKANSLFDRAYMTALFDLGRRMGADPDAWQDVPALPVPRP